MIIKSIAIFETERVRIINVPILPIIYISLHSQTALVNAGFENPFVFYWEKTPGKKSPPHYMFFSNLLV